MPTVILTDDDDDDGERSRPRALEGDTVIVNRRALLSRKKILFYKCTRCKIDREKRIRAGNLETSDGKM